MSSRPQSNRSVAVALLCLALAAASLSGASPAEVDRIAELLELQPGQTLADVGAGAGDFAIALAEKVGAEGRVLATEVDADLVAEIERRALAQGLAQVIAILGTQAHTGLGAGCCDAILLRLVYHHFQEPARMRADLWNALEPGGLIAIVDIVPQENWRKLPGVPERGGHGVVAGDLLADMVGSGFELVGRENSWNGDEDRYALLFRRPAGGADR